MYKHTIELPCKIGDVFYVIRGKEGEKIVDSGIVEYFTYNSGGLTIHMHLFNEDCGVAYGTVGLNQSNLFYLRRDAEYYLENYSS